MKNLQFNIYQDGAGRVGSKKSKPIPTSSHADFTRPAKVVGRGWGEILALHHEAKRG